jgi:DNA (cytosine-5)-methyltransferase 1
MGELNCVSVFSGAMGLDIGLEKAGFNVLFAADNMSAAVSTIRANRPGMPVFADDIRSLTATRFGGSLV